MKDKTTELGGMLMVRVYIASSLKNFRLNYELHNLLESRGVSCFLPQRDALEKSLKRSGKSNYETSSKIRNLNVQGIRSADLLLVVARNLGCDSSWECGFGYGLGKPLILIRSQEEKEKVEDVYMLFNSLSNIIEVHDYRLEELRKAIATLDFASVSGKK